MCSLYATYNYNLFVNNSIFTPKPDTYQVFLLRWELPLYRN